MTLFFRESIPVRMLQMNPQKANAFDMKVNDAQLYSRTTYTNDVKREKCDAVPTSMPNIGTPHRAGVTLRRKKPNVNGVSVLCRPGIHL